MPKVRFEIVIDADVARSSGETNHPVSSSCRKTLILILEHQHRFVACETLRAEWKKHSSVYAKRWLTSMIARKQVTFIDTADDLITQVTALSIDEKQKDIVLKDAHLIEAARRFGRFVTSRDEAARTSIAAIGEIRNLVVGIVWANPVSHAAPLEATLKECRMAEALPRFS